jgi:hypothetical protein
MTTKLFRNVCQSWPVCGSTVQRGNSKTNGTVTQTWSFIIPATCHRLLTFDLELAEEGVVDVVVGVRLLLVEHLPPALFARELGLLAHICSRQCAVAAADRLPVPATGSTDNALVNAKSFHDRTAAMAKFAARRRIFERKKRTTAKPVHHLATVWLCRSLRLVSPAPSIEKYALLVCWRGYQ